MRKRAAPWIAVAGAILSMAGARAQALTDPTRPPSAAAESGGEQQEASALRLQSVLLSPRRKVAVINGVAVPLGGTIGEARLVKITETEAVLKSGNETEVLKLFPGVEKEPRRREVARSRRGTPVTPLPRQGGLQ
jgi:MSHA biogenesis protein MshK